MQPQTFLVENQRRSALDNFTRTTPSHDRPSLRSPSYVGYDIGYGATSENPSYLQATGSLTGLRLQVSRLVRNSLGNSNSSVIDSTAQPLLVIRLIYVLPSLGECAPPQPSFAPVLGSHFVSGQDSR